MTDPDPRQTTAVYRMFDAAGVLLYVGASSDPGRRLNQHSNRKDWWSSVATVALEHHPTRQAALAAEQAAIVDERPLHSMSQAPCSGCGHPTTFHRDGTGPCRALGCPACQTYESVSGQSLVDHGAWLTGFDAPGVSTPEKTSGRVD